MKLRQLLFLSLVCNVVLIATWIFLPRRTSGPTIAESMDGSTPRTTTMGVMATDSVTIISNAPFSWNTIQSDDCHQYVANLRAVGCPERTIRDIIVADIDAHYAAKSRTSVSPPLWQNTDHRRTETLAQRAKALAIAKEKLALIKELLGYEWENRAGELWEGDFGLAKFLGFLSDAKSLRLTAIAGAYLGQARDVRESANNILIDEDRAQLRKLYDNLVNDVSQLLTPTELDELALRVQAKGFLEEGEGIGWDGVSITTAQLREFVRLSTKYKDTWQNEFLSARESSKEEQARKADFEKQVEKLFGAERYAEYRRAQDPDFRETWAFMQEQELPLDTATRVFSIRRTTEEQAAKLRDDASMSPDERASALSALKSRSAAMISSVMGNKGQEYLEYRAQWLEKLGPAPSEPRPQTPLP